MTELDRLLAERAELDRKIITAIVRQENGMGSCVAALVEKYGEVVSYGEAAQILNVVTQTLTNMVKDGRLVRVEGGITVRSIGQYLDKGRPSAQRVKHMEAYRERRKEA